MFKRVRWVGFGAALGVGGSIYAQLKVRRTAQRYLPPEVGSRVAERARWLGQEVQDAVAEGRQAMAERDAELRARIDPARPRRPGTIRDAATRDAATRDAATLRDAGTGRALDRPTGPLRGLPDLEPPGRTDGARRRARRDRGPHRR